jgi:hypothetical protein
MKSLIVILVIGLAIFVGTSFAVFSNDESNVYAGKVTFDGAKSRIKTKTYKDNEIDEEVELKPKEFDKKTKSFLTTILNLSVKTVEIGTLRKDVLKELGKPISSKKGRHFPCDEEGEVRTLRYQDLVLELIENYNNKKFFVASTIVKSDKWSVMNSRDGKIVKIGEGVEEVKEKFGDGKLIHDDGLDTIAYPNTDGFAYFYFKNEKLIKIRWEINLC